MRLASFEAIVQALEAGGVRYLVAGGLAVNAHDALPVRFVSLKALIAMKTQADRPQDRDDIVHLRMKEDGNAS